MAELEPLAGTALRGQTGLLGRAEGALTWILDHINQGAVEDIAQQMGMIDEVVATIGVAVSLHGQGMTALRAKGADAWGDAHPISQYGIEELHIDLAYIVAPEPLFEEAAAEIAPLLGR